MTIDVDIVRSRLADILGKDGGLKELLEEAYIKYSANELGPMLEVSNVWLLNQLKACGIPIKPRGGMQRVRSRVKITLEDWQNLSMVEITNKYDCSKSYAYKVGKRLGYPSRKKYGRRR